MLTAKASPVKECVCRVVRECLKAKYAPADYLVVVAEVPKDRGQGI